MSNKILKKQSHIKLKEFISRDLSKYYLNVFKKTSLIPSYLFGFVVGKFH